MSYEVSNIPRLALCDEPGCQQTTRLRCKRCQQTCCLKHRTIRGLCRACLEVYLRQVSKPRMPSREQ